MDSRTAVNDVKFAPRHLGLQLVSIIIIQYLHSLHHIHVHLYMYLYMYTIRGWCVCVQASCSTDGQLRIYEAPDVMNLSQWTLNVSKRDTLLL